MVGVVKGRSRSPLAPVLVGAHYDSVIAAPCADDNAAAVAIALQVGQWHIHRRVGQLRVDHTRLGGVSVQ